MESTSRFEIERRIGAGGMGEVYEAFDRVRNTRVALKTLTDLNPDKLLALKREFRSVVNVSHANLVTFYELLCENGQWFLSMEYIEGTDFLSYVRAAGTCDLARLRRTVPQIVHAVNALHRAGILHCDLKPSNVQVTSDGYVVVLDFGLAAPIHAAEFEREKNARIFGTAVYMSPERVTRSTLTEASDWYALGVMLYEALAGRLPYEGSALTILAAQQVSDAAPVSSIAPETPGDLASIVDGLLRRDAHTRLSGVDVLRVLEDEGGADADMRAAPSPLFVGREAELSVLRDVFTHMNVGTRIVSVHGRSGIGKSALVSNFLGEVAGKAVVLAGRCYEQESVPYKAFDSVFDALGRFLSSLDAIEVHNVIPRDIGALAQIFPVLNRVDEIANVSSRGHAASEPTELRRRAFEALRQLLRALGERRPVIIYIDDLQWADLDSAALLRETLRPPAAPRFMLIGAWRHGLESKSAFLAALRSDTFRAFALDVRDLFVGPLSASDTRALANAMVPSDRTLSGRQMEAALRESAGNPYFLRELIAGVEEDVDAATGSWSVRLTLDDVLRRRVAALPAEARNAVEIVCVAGRPLHEDDLRRAANLDSADRKTLALLRARNLVQGAADEIEAYHDRLRETVVAFLDADTRRERHARLAVVLRTSSASQDAESLAGHLEAAAETNEAGRYYAIAAERAATSLAFLRAADLFGKALALCTASPDERRRLQTRLADALANAGRGAEAARAYREAAEGASEEDARTLARQEAYWYVSSGYMAEGRDAMERFLRAAGLAMPSPRLLPLKLTLAELRLAVRGLEFRERRESLVPERLLDRADFTFDAARSLLQIDTPTGIYFLTRSLLAALEAGEPIRVARAMVIKWSLLLGFKNPLASRQARKLGTAFMALRGHVDTPYVRGVEAWAHGFVAFFQGRYADASRQMLIADKVFTEECTGVAWEHVGARVYELVAHAHMGNVSYIGESIGRVLQEISDTGNRTFEHTLGCHPWAYAEMGAGRPERALAIMEEAAYAFRHGYTLQRAALGFMKTWVLLYQGRSREAWQHIQTEWPRLVKNNYLRLHQLMQWVTHARAQAALAVSVDSPHDESLLRTAEKCAKMLAADDVSACSPAVASLIRSGVAARRGRAEDAARLLEGALPMFDKTEVKAFAAASRRRLGEIVGGQRGEQLVAEADRSMLALGVSEPANMTRAFANGFQ